MELITKYEKMHETMTQTLKTRKEMITKIAELVANKGMNIVRSGHSSEQFFTWAIGGHMDVENKSEKKVRKLFQDVCIDKVTEAEIQ